MLIQNPSVEKALRFWLEKVVIGLNLCPFAARPHLENRVRLICSDSTTPENLLTDLTCELEKLDRTQPNELETTLIAVPNMLTDFYDYNAFLDSVDHLLMQGNWEGVYQVASFHPNYQFAGTQPEDQENLTNRSPYPVLHLIREESLAQAIAHHPNPDDIPNQNIKRVEGLTQETIQVLFPYLRS